MRIAVAQINPVVGDITGNLEKILDVVASTMDKSPDLMVFPELVLTGYPPRDLLERRWLIKGARSAADRIACETAGSDCGLILGLPTPTGRDIGRGLYNSAVLIHDGAIRFTQHKQLLPTYDVFDEDRYFDSAGVSDVVEFKGERLGISICEDAWNDPELWRKRIYTRDPIEELARNGATLMINISASPYHIGKEQIRRRIIQSHARRFNVPFLFVNQVGGNDELIFDGRSLFVSAGGRIVDEFDPFREEIKIIDTTDTVNVDRIIHDAPETNLFNALALGLRDYVGKCGFTDVLVGLSGGIDSALVAVLAVAALGPAHVTGITMPGPFSSAGSVDDSLALAQNLEIRCH
nr:nitrilase-related carbon-nitrogen hydrolase [bacterium]